MTSPKPSKTQRIRSSRVGIVLLGAASFGVADAPKERPLTWAQSIVGTSIGNCFKVSADLYRSEQPTVSDINDLKALGIRTILNLREYHEDDAKLAQAGFVLVHDPVAAGSLTSSDMTRILGRIRDAKKPVLVHCWHGSDRTGFTVAGYRMIFQGWTVADAVEEFKLGGFGYHKRFYPKLPVTLGELDVAAIQKQLGITPAP
ncbi:MAG: tyrosine-protein phosphatase [Fibrobacterota bacterium]|nr:tyrosine-protein phosphatase [Fibrobacterota bacterium]QQS04732.1 MAG: tyrosine-protein phosphatase [Fibrobacterota bacterium]